MTYRKLKEYLGKLSEKQLDQTVLMYDENWENEFSCLETFIGNWEDFPDAPGKHIHNTIEKNNPYFSF